VLGAHYDDLLNIKDEEHIGERLLFGYFILSCRRKSDWLERILVKTIRDDGA
jgi:hypothetical protein